MRRNVGIKSNGIRIPIYRTGDDLETMIKQSINDVIGTNEIQLQDHDVLCITESLVARSQNNYATVDQIAQSTNELFFQDFSGKKELLVVFPILSRNRFAIVLKGIARAVDKIYLLLSTPTDEVGNSTQGIHEFTGINYPEYYSNLIKQENAECEVIIDNNFYEVFVCPKVLVASIHDRYSLQSTIKNTVSNWQVETLDKIMSYPINNSGWNKYGVLGSNKVSEEKIKLFPRQEEAKQLCMNLQRWFDKEYSTCVEVMVYGDGAFKDPVGKIWELADPVVCLACTNGLNKRPNELKIKYLADNKYANLSGEELTQAMKNDIQLKPKDLIGSMDSQGTTPRQLTDLLGSLADLTSGSGDRGTPLVLIQGYFDNYAND